MQPMNGFPHKPQMQPGKELRSTLEHIATGMVKPSAEMIERRITELVADNAADGSSMPEMIDGGELLAFIRGYKPADYDRVADDLYGAGNGLRNNPGGSR